MFFSSALKILLAAVILISAAFMAVAGICWGTASGGFWGVAGFAGAVVASTELVDRESMKPVRAMLLVWTIVSVLMLATSLATRQLSQPFFGAVFLMLNIGFALLILRAKPETENR